MASVVSMTGTLVYCELLNCPYLKQTNKSCICGTLGHPTSENYSLQCFTWGIIAGELDKNETSLLGDIKSITANASI